MSRIFWFEQLFVWPLLAILKGQYRPWALCGRPDQGWYGWISTFWCHSKLPYDGHSISGLPKQIMPTLLWSRAGQSDLPKIWNIQKNVIWKMNGANLGQTVGWIHETPKILASPKLWLICYLLTPFFPFHHHILAKDVFIPSPVLFIHQMMIIMTKYWLACVCCM